MTFKVFRILFIILMFLFIFSVHESGQFEL